MNTPVQLALVCCIIAAVTIYMACVGMQSSWQYYLTVDECLAAADSIARQRVRVSGKVAADSLKAANHDSASTFVLRGKNGDLNVVCTGSLPDNLAESMNVVVEGYLENGQLRGEKVMTRCASKYESGSRDAVAAAWSVGESATSEGSRR